MAGLAEKFKVLTDILGFGQDNDGYDNDMEESMLAPYGDVEGTSVLKPHFGSNPMEKRNNVRLIGGANNSNYEVVVFEPRAFNESINIVDALKTRKTVILNLQLLDREQSQRIVDFLCGCTHALDGSQRKIGEFVFIFTPANINISQEVINSKLSRDAIWTRNEA